MAKSLGLGRTYPLSEKQVKARVLNTPGNYAFGYNRYNFITKIWSFHVRYVGRSDNDLKVEILAQMKDDDKNQLTHFKFSHAANTPLRAYGKECENYHDFGGNDALINQIHPARVAGYDKDALSCPITGCDA